MLTDKHCKNAACPPDKKRARFTDALGLYLEVSPAGSKRWFWKIYTDGKEGRMALGSYQTVGRRPQGAGCRQGTEVRGARPGASAQLGKAQGHHGRWGHFQGCGPGVARQASARMAPSYAERALRQLERDLFPWIGERPMGSIEPMELLPSKDAPYLALDATTNCLSQF